MDVRHYSESAVLRDGRQLLIRASRPEDMTVLEQGFRSLDKQSVYLRFFSPKQRLTEDELNAATEVDFVNEVALIALLLEEESSQLAGACRYAVYDPNQRPARAEYASTIVPAYQGLGIGSLLFQHLVYIAKAGGIEYLEADVLQNNQAMIRLLSNSGFPIEKSLDGNILHLSLKIAERSP